ncbi:MAG: UDP-N-acetylmuramoyl-L-alanyl-D-glutamate--2,6-diaminopimelate ligase [Caulobacterales bacterium]
MKLKALVKESEMKGLTDAGDIEISGLSADSRRIQPGFLFAALPGSATDGAKFAASAVEKGAVAIIAPRGAITSATVPVIETDDPRLALALAASAFYARQPKFVAAVTGTNGKSSPVDFLRQIWAFAGKKAASMGTLGAIGPSGAVDLGHTTPDPVAIHATLARLADEGVTHAAMEASSHGLDQRRLDGVKLSAAAFTNLTQDHLDYHHDLNTYAAAKMRLFSELLPKGAPAIINADAAEYARFENAANAAGLQTLTCGWRGSYLKIGEISPKPAAQRLDLRWKGRDILVDLPLIGEFQAINAVAAAALALSLGEDEAKVFAGMRTLRPVRGRMEHVGATKDGAHVFVDYAHTPDGLDVLLRAARPHAPGRIILVFGCGGDRDAGKRPKMGAIGAKFADVVIVTDDNPRSEDAAEIRRQVLVGCPGAEEIGDRGDAIRSAVNRLKPGDALMIAGKGHETGQIIKGVTHPFSDQDTALDALRAIGGAGLDQ